MTRRKIEPWTKPDSPGGQHQRKISNEVSHYSLAIHSLGEIYRLSWRISDFMTGKPFPVCLQGYKISGVKTIPLTTQSPLGA